MNIVINIFQTPYKAIKIYANYICTIYIRSSNVSVSYKENNHRKLQLSSLAKNVYKNICNKQLSKRYWMLSAISLTAHILLTSDGYVYINR